MGSSSSGVRYPADGQPVTPLWVEGVDRSLTDPTAAEVSVPAVSEGRAYVASNRVYAFPLGCALDGSTCDPLWRSELPASPGSSAVLHWSQPAANNGVVFSSSDRPAAFLDASCAASSGACPPVWTGPPGGWVSPPALARSTMVVTYADGRVVAFQPA